MSKGSHRETFKKLTYLVVTITGIVRIYHWGLWHGHNYLHVIIPPIFISEWNIFPPINGVMKH